MTSKKAQSSGVAGISRHYEDRLQHIGAGNTTGNFTEHYFDGGPSCGNGITCATTESKSFQGPNTKPKWRKPPK